MHTQMTHLLTAPCRSVRPSSSSASFASASSRGRTRKKLAHVAHANAARANEIFGETAAPRNLGAGEPTAAERFRKAEPAKEAVKAFIKDWAAAPAVQGERSHDDIVLAVRELSEFYKANGSRAALDKPTRDSVLEKLYDARDALPKAPPTLADRLLGL